MYGPAIIESYELESKKATYPRIIIDTKLLELIKSDENINKIKDKNLILVDFDKNYFINFLGKGKNELINSNEFLTIKRLIEHSYNKQKNNPNILMKYFWLINYFNYSITQNKKNHSKKYYQEINNIKEIEYSLKPRTWQNCTTSQNLKSTK